MSNDKILTWEEIEEQHQRNHDLIKECERKLYSEDLKDDELASLTEQLNHIVKTIEEFQKAKDEFLKE